MTEERIDELNAMVHQIDRLRGRLKAFRPDRVTFWSIHEGDTDLSDAFLAKIEAMLKEELEKSLAELQKQFESA